MSDKPLPPEIEADIAQAVQEHMAVIQPPLHPDQVQPFADTLCKQFRKHYRHATAVAEASHNPFPGPLKEAFAGQPRTLFGLTLQPVTIELISILERIQSPFLPTMGLIEQLRDKTSEEMSRAIEEKIHPTFQQQIETNFCFVTPAQELLKLLAKSRAEFSQAASEKIGRTLHPSQFSELNREIMLWYWASFSTCLEYENRTADGAQSFPSAPAQTASAGA